MSHCVLTDIHRAVTVCVTVSTNEMIKLVLLEELQLIYFYPWMTECMIMAGVCESEYTAYTFNTFVPIVL